MNPLRAYAKRFLEMATARRPRLPTPPTAAELKVWYSNYTEYIRNPINDISAIYTLFGSYVAGKMLHDNISAMNKVSEKLDDMGTEIKGLAKVVTAQSETIDALQEELAHLQSKDDEIEEENDAGFWTWVSTLFYRWWYLFYRWW